jgi:hypothetical protein
MESISTTVTKKYGNTKLVARCGCCGTEGPGLQMVKSFGDKLCPECRIEWRDYPKR